MRTKGLTEAYVLEYFAVKVCGIGSDASVQPDASNIGVTVEFDLVLDDDGPIQVKLLAVKSAGAALETEDITLNFWAGLNLLPFLSKADEQMIEEEMVKRQQAVIDDHNESADVDAGIAAREDRDAGLYGGNWTNHK